MSVDFGVYNRDTMDGSFNGSDFYDGENLYVYRWNGTLADLDEWLDTPWGQMEMYEMRKEARVRVIANDGEIEELWDYADIQLSRRVPDANENAS